MTGGCGGSGDGDGDGGGGGRGGEGSGGSGLGGGGRGGGLTGGGGGGRGGGGGGSAYAARGAHSAPRASASARESGGILRASVCWPDERMTALRRRHVRVSARAVAGARTTGVCRGRFLFSGLKSPARLTRAPRRHALRRRQSRRRSARARRTLQGPARSAYRRHERAPGGRGAARDAAPGRFRWHLQSCVAKSLRCAS